MTSEGMIDFTMSLPNLGCAHDATEATALDIRLEACVYEDLSCDLILGLPVIGHWLQSIEWDDWGSTESEDASENGTRLHLLDVEVIACMVAASGKEEGR